MRACSEFSLKPGSLVSLLLKPDVSQQSFSGKGQYSFYFSPISTTMIILTFGANVFILRAEVRFNMVNDCLWGLNP